MKKTTKQQYNDLMYKLYGVGNPPVKKKPLSTRQLRRKMMKKLYGVEV